LHLKTVFMNVSPRVMTDELAARNQERGVTRRRFVGITVASGAALLAGKSDVILGADTATSSNMATNPTFNLGGDFTVNRLGFGAMRVTGEGIWGWPTDRQNALKVLRRAVELGVTLNDTAGYKRTAHCRSALSLSERARDRDERRSHSSRPRSMGAKLPA
jgi:hypothetical protein